MLNNKNKTISTIIHTEQEHQQLTTKKNSLNKINSCIKISNSSCKTSKSNLGKIQARNGRVSAGRKENITDAKDIKDANKC